MICIICGKTFEKRYKTLTCSRECSSIRRSQTYARYSVVPKEKYGKLTALEPTNERKHACVVWKCRCACGTIISVRSDLLISGKVKSCGCLHKETAAKNVNKAHAANFAQGTNLGKINNDNIQKNNSSGVRGVSWHKSEGKWQARIMYKRQAYCLGYYDNIEDAAAAREAAVKKHFGRHRENTLL